MGAISPLAMLLSGLAMKQATANPAVKAGIPNGYGALSAAVPSVVQPAAVPVKALPTAPLMPQPVAAPTMQAAIPQSPGQQILASMMPEPIKYRNDAVDARRAGLQANYAEAAKPLNREDYKPKWQDRLFGGMAAFGAGLQHNPNAFDIGTSIVNNRFNKAEYDRQQRAKGAEQELENFDKGEDQFNKQFDREMTQQRYGMERTKMENTFDSDIQQETGTDGKTHYYKVSQTGRRIEVPEPSSVVMDRWRTKDEERRAKADEQKAKSDDRRWDSFDKRTAAMEARANKPEKENEFDVWRAAFKRDNGREPTAEEIANRKARGNGPSSAGTFKDANAVTKWDNDWYAKQRDRVRKDKMAARTMAGGSQADPQQLQEEYAAIEKQYQDEATKHEETKKQIHTHLKAGRTVSVNETGEVTPSSGGAAPSNPYRKSVVPANPYRKR